MARDKRAVPVVVFVATWSPTAWPLAGDMEKVPMDMTFVRLDDKMDAQYFVVFGATAGLINTPNTR